MHAIHLRGPKKAVYMVRHNLLGYDLPETSDELFVYDPATYRYPEKLKDAKEDP